MSECAFRHNALANGEGHLALVNAPLGVGHLPSAGQAHPYT
jgi:hypothetical protein